MGLERTLDPACRKRTHSYADAWVEAKAENRVAAFETIFKMDVGGEGAS